MKSSGNQSSAVDQLTHPPDRPLQPPEHRIADDRVSDIELLDLRNGGDGADVEVRESVAGVDGESGLTGMPRCFLELDERPRVLPPGVGIPPGMKLDGRHTQARRAVDGAGIGINEEGDADVGVLEAADGTRQTAVARLDREPPFGGDFLPALRHQRGLVGAEPGGDPDDLGTRGQLEIEGQAGAGGERLDVRVLNVAAVFAKVDGNAVGTPGERVGRGADGIRLIRFPRFADGRDVINVDVEAHGFLPSVQLPPTGATPLNRALLVVLLCAGAACSQYQAGQVPEPKSPNLLLSRFLDAVKAKDTRTMAALWGTADGPWRKVPDAYRDSVMTSFQIYLRHDTYKVLDGPLPSSSDSRVMTFHVE